VKTDTRVKIALLAVQKLLLIGKQLTCTMGDN
jgi:hypothetical protein